MLLSLAPMIHLKMDRLCYDGSRIDWKNKVFEPADIMSALIVIAATNSKS